MKPEPMEIRVEMSRSRQAQEVAPGRQNYRRGQRQQEEIRELRALSPMGSHERELCPRGRTELG